jgi:hypothetical protein
VVAHTVLTGVNANRPSLWTALTLGISIILAANSFSNYRALSRHVAVSAPRTLAPAALSSVVWTGPRDNAEPRERPPANSAAGDLRSLKHGLRVNTSLALVLIFAVAASSSRKRS